MSANSTQKLALVRRERNGSGATSMEPDWRQEHNFQTIPVARSSLGPQDMVFVLLRPLNSSRQWIREQLWHTHHQRIRLLEPSHNFTSNSVRSNHYICCPLGDVFSTQSPWSEKERCRSDIRAASTCWCSWHSCTSLRQKSCTSGMLLCKSGPILYKRDD